MNLTPKRPAVNANLVGQMALADAEPEYRDVAE